MQSQYSTSFLSAPKHNNNHSVQLFSLRLFINSRFSAVRVLCLHADYVIDDV